MSLLWCSPTVEYYTAMKKNESQPHRKTWANPTDITVSKRFQAWWKSSFLYKVQEQAKLIYADRIQKDAYLRGKSIGLGMKKQEEPSRQ